MGSRLLLSLVSKSNGRPYLKTVQDQMATVTERVVPIQLEGAVGNPPGGASASQASKAPYHLPNEGRNASKRRSLIVTHEDGSRDEIHGLVTKLSSSSDDIHSKAARGVNIQEIGADTLRREIRRSRSGSRSKEDDPRNGGFQSIIPTNSVRLVPIKMPDGRIVSRDPDETMDIKTEFTNYCHQEFPDKSPETFETRKGRSRRKSGMSPSSSEHSTPTKERIVPIQLETGEKFMPKFTQLDDLEPPEWSAFSPKYKPSNQTIPSPKPGQSPVKSVLKQESNPFKEKIVPIRVEGVEPPIPKPRTSPASVLDSPRRSALDRSKDRGGKKSTEKRVHHTVRFNVDEDPYEDVLPPSPSIAKTTRSSSLDSKNRNHLPPNGTSSAERTRHRSGGSATEKTLHEIDCDINKIWKELQELETFPPAPSLNGKPPVVGGSLPSRSPYTSGLRNGSPIRRGQTAPVTPTPVKIRTYTTPTASVVATPASAPSSRPTSPYMDSIVTSSTSPTSAATNTTPLNTTNNHNGATSSPTPWRPSSAMSSPLASSSYMSYKSSSQYNPRRDLGPTRPGSITPIVRKISGPLSSPSPHPTSSANSSLPSASPGSLATSSGASSTSTARPGVKAAVATSTTASDTTDVSVGTSAPTLSPGSLTNGTTGKNSIFNYGNNNNNHKITNQTTKAGASVSSQTSVNRNSGVEFFPRFEERPRENSLSRGQLIEEADEPDTSPTDKFNAGGDTQSDLMANAEDKSTQTDTSALSKSSKNKCNLQ